MPEQEPEVVVASYFDPFYRQVKRLFSTGRCEIGVLSKGDGGFIKGTFADGADYETECLNDLLDKGVIGPDTIAEPPRKKAHKEPAAARKKAYKRPAKATARGHLD